MGIDVVMAAVGFGGPTMVLGSVIAWDRLREPFRNPQRPFAIGGERDYRDACRRVERLTAKGDFRHAHRGTLAICAWLRSEYHFGSRRRQQHLAHALQAWTARCEEFDPRAELFLG